MFALGKRMLMCLMEEGGLSVKIHPSPIKKKSTNKIFVLLAKTIQGNLFFKFGQGLLEMLIVVN